MEVISEIERDLVFFDESGGGVTITGGEPLGQPEFLEALLLACRERRIHTTIETCGAASRENVLRMGELADLILYDLKILDAGRHRVYTGASNRRILENLEALVEAGAQVVVRVPVVPGVNDGEDDVRALCEYLAVAGAPSGVVAVPSRRRGKVPATGTRVSAGANGDAIGGRDGWDGRADGSGGNSGEG